MPASSSKVLLPGRDTAELKLTFAGNIVKHLGVQMYAGRPVPAIAELVSNAWDADAKEVEVRLPLGESWDPNSDQVIEVSDDGNGMTWEMVRDAYLDVGRDRREIEKTDKSPGGRLLQGRKGVGKLAGFGIADVVEVQTVHKSRDPDVGEYVLMWFRLSLADLRKADKQPAQADVVFAGPVTKAPKGGRRTRGTTVTLRQLHGRKALNAERFLQSVSRRFLLVGPKFRVRVNGQDLRSEDIDLQWRWPPKKGWNTDEVRGCGPVQYWIGFTPQPRKQNEGDLSGVLVYTRNKVSQDATFFDISGGVTGQHGLRYLVGMVKAEWLDSGLEAPDLIATHRGAIAWESPQGQAFQDWGQRLLKKLLAEWAKLRTKLREKQVEQIRPELKARIEKLAPAYRDVAVRFYEKFKTVEMEPEEFEDILSWFLDALENATLRSILQKLRETKAADLEQLDDLLEKMAVRTAVTLLQIINSNLAAIDTLERMHRTDASERRLLSKHIERNPWLIEPTWILNRPEARVSTWIRDEFGLKPTGGKSDKDRVDFFCVGVGGALHIVEIKRGAHVAVEKDFSQAERYRKYVITRFDEISDPKGFKYATVQAHLIAARLHTDAASVKEAYADKGWVFFTTWDDLIERAKVVHSQFRGILEARVAERAEEGEDSG